MVLLSNEKYKEENGKKFILKNNKWIRLLDEKKIISLYMIDKLSINKISKKFRCDNNLIKDILLNNNIELRSHKESIKISMNNDTTKEKIKESYKNSLQKRKETCLIKYGTEWASQSNQFKEKIKKTSERKYGTSHFLKSDEIKQKRIDTLKNKYDVENISQLEITKEKIKQTSKEKYGTDNPLQSEIIKKKITNTNLKKYNKKNPSQVEIFKEKRKNTLLEKYGVENIMYSSEIKNKLFENKRNSYKNKIEVVSNYLKIELIDELYIDSHYFHNWKCLVCNNVFNIPWYYICQGYRCPVCNPKKNGVSKSETELLEFIKSIYKNNIKENLRSILSPYELDIFIPEKNIAIEFNGLYWHRDKICDKKYHINKTINCQKNGIRLIHIFEDEWIFKKDIVKSRLKQILNLNNKDKIYARKCIIKEIDSKTKNDFLEKFHLQGKDISKVNLGAFYNDNLVSVMTFSKGNISKGSKSEEGVWELNRFCSDYNYQVIGIASKLLKYFQRKYQWKQIFSYADRRWSDGNLYYKLGFNLDNITSVNYWYIKNYQRIHRFNLRKRADEPKEIPEWFLRESEGYNRIWDCGNYKFKIEKK